MSRDARDSLPRSSERSSPGPYSTVSSWPGSELPSVRDLATAKATTAATASRAYRHLAEYGVISLAPRRRAMVSQDGPAAARRLLGGTRAFRLAGSDDPAMSLLLRHLGDRVVGGTRAREPARVGRGGREHR